MLRHRFIRLAVLSIAAAAAASTAAFGGGSRTTADTSPLIVNSPFGPATLDLLANPCGAHDMWASNFYAQLTQWGQTAGPTKDAFGRPFKGGLVVTKMDVRKLQPYAVSWKQLSPSSFTLTVNPNARFNDGTPMTAAALKASYDRSNARGACGLTYWAGGLAGNPANVTTVNARTLRLDYDRVGAPYVAGWAQPPASIFDPNAIASHPDTQGVTVNPYWAANIAGGGGPYVLESYQPNKQMTMRRNPRYFGRKPVTDRVVVNFIASEPSLLLEARSGKADVTFGLTPQAVLSLKNNPNVNVVAVPNFYQYSVNLSWKMPPLDNKSFRAALTYAIPYKDILSRVQYGFGSLYYGPIAQNLRFFNPYVAKPRPYDLAQARRLLEKSGVKTPVDLQMVIQAGNPVAEQSATILQSVWKQIGINLTVTPLSPTEFNTTVQAHKAQMSIRVDGGGSPYADWQLNYDMRCGIPFNLSDVCIPAADALLNQAEASTNPKTQQKLYNQITKLWRAQSPKIVLFGYSDLVVLSKRVKQYMWFSRPGLGIMYMGK
jgi:peptide/nickel transport system substrate-binding protein